MPSNTVRLILGDSLVKLKDLESGSVDAVVSDVRFSATQSLSHRPFGVGLEV